MTLWQVGKKEMYAEAGGAEAAQLSGVERSQWQLCAQSRRYSDERRKVRKELGKRNWDTNLHEARRKLPTAPILPYSRLVPIVGVEICTHRSSRESFSVNAFVSREGHSLAQKFDNYCPTEKIRSHKTSQL